MANDSDYRPIVFMFAGQGSQYYRMGEELYGRNFIFKHWMDKASYITYRRLGFSITEIIYDKSKSKQDELNKTLWTHPAIFAVQYALAQTLTSYKINPDMLLGASLGEFVAATLAGFLAFEEGLDATIDHAKSVERNCIPGKTLAIFDNVNLYYSSEINRYTTLSADNFQGHFTVAGEIGEIERAKLSLDRLEINNYAPPILHAFHSPLIDPARNIFCKNIGTIAFHAPKLPFISCSTSQKVDTMNATSLWNATRFPILFRRTILSLEGRKNYRYLDLSPTGTLSTFVKYNLAPGSRSEIFPTLSPYNSDEDRGDGFIRGLAKRLGDA